MVPIQPTQRLNVKMIPGLSPPGSSVTKHAAKGPPSLEVKTACQGELSPLKASSHRNILSGDEECGLEREEGATYSLEFFPLNGWSSGSKSLALKINNSERAANSTSFHTPVVYFYRLYLVFAESLLCGQPLCNTLRFEYVSLLTVSSSQCFERVLEEQN